MYTCHSVPQERVHVFGKMMQCTHVHTDTHLSLWPTRTCCAPTLLIIVVCVYTNIHTERGREREREREDTHTHTHTHIIRGIDICAN